MSNKILHCDLHDYLEIACMFHYEVELLLENQSSIVGIAMDTRINTDKEELLELKVTADNGEEKLVSVPVLTLCKLKVLTPGARFTEVNF